MTVSELIERLQKERPEMEVYISYTDIKDRGRTNSIDHTGCNGVEFFIIPLSDTLLV